MQQPHRIKQSFVLLLLVFGFLANEGTLHHEAHRHACMSDQGEYYSFSVPHSFSQNETQIIPIELGQRHKHELCAICQLASHWAHNHLASNTDSDSSNRLRLFHPDFHGVKQPSGCRSRAPPACVPA